MRHGYTTGACSTAERKRLAALVTGEVRKNVTIQLPVGQEATFEVTSYLVTEFGYV